MKKILSTLLVVLLFSAVPFAQDVKLTNLNAKQVSKLDVSGKWVGKRFQYSWDKKTFMETFEYEFELKQNGDVITGTSTIISANGDYADMNIEGYIVGDVLHFAEKSVKNAIRPDGKVWCFKHGELKFRKADDNLKMIGETSSSMEFYNYPCSGGVTELTKVDNNNNATMLKSDFNTDVTSGSNMQINVYPNPYIENVNIAYNLTEDAKVKIEMFDISGKQISKIFEGNQKAGNYNTNFSGKDSGYMAGIFIVKMTVNGEVFSRQIVQMQ